MVHAMKVRVACPNTTCGKSYEVEPSQLGSTAECKKCGQKFTLEATKDTAAGGVAETRPQAPPANPSPSLPADVPQKLGRFEIRSRLGAGGFGAVYRAYDPVLEREVALKVPRAAVLEKPEARARFLREPKAAARLQHPHIVPVFDAGTDGENYYIASAFIAGQTLQALIATDRPDLRQSAQIVHDIAEALHYAHGKGIVHRDVKPGNIMIDADGQAMLMDFGIAHIAESEEQLTHDGSLIGTPTYMATEQADRSFGDIGPHSDQYALGVVLYELLCGDTPYTGPPNIVIYNLLNEEPTPPRAINAQLPRDLETICLKAMAKRLADRYADCGVMADDLRRFLADEPIQARRLGPLERLARWYRRNTALAVAGMAALVLLVVAAIASVGYWGQSTARSQAVSAKTQAEERYRQAEALWQRALQELEKTRAELSQAEADLKAAEDRVANAQTEQEKAEAQKAVAEARAKLVAAEAKVAESRVAEAEAEKAKAEATGRSAVSQSDPGTTASAEPAVVVSQKLTEWEDVFNGRDLSGWTPVGTGVWSVKDGVLIADAAGEGWLMSDREYADFEVEIEYRLPAEGNSGVLLRAWPEGPPDGSNFIEVQLTDDKHPRYAQLEPRFKTGSIFGIVARRVEIPVETLRWYRIGIRLEGSHIQVAHDGVNVLDVDLQAFARQTSGIRGFARPTGRIGLQMPMFRIPAQFRSIRVREIAGNRLAKSVESNQTPWKPRLYPLAVEFSDANRRSVAGQSHLFRKIGFDGVGYPLWLDGSLENNLRIIDEARLDVLLMYAVVSVRPGSPPYDPQLPGTIQELKGRPVTVCVLMQGLPPADPQGLESGVRILRSLGNVAGECGLRISVYPHAGDWTSSFLFALQLVQMTDRPNVGVAFNVCHWLMVDDDKDFRPVLRSNAGRIFAVTINGAQRGTKSWSTLVQPLDKGDFDNRELLALLREIDYRGPIGLQCYGIPGDAGEHLQRSMDAWKAWMP
jgi:sugar phosphate isomerase/epimerase/tRNA A-37 threonylcarbamoyl transferase component Bud32